MLNKLKISHRIALCFAACFALVVVIAGFSLAQMRAIQHQLDGGLQDNALQMQNIAGLRKNVFDRAIAVRNTIFLNGGAEVGAQLQQLSVLEAQFAKQAQGTDGSGGELWQRVRAAEKNFAALTHQLARFASERAGADAAAAELAEIQRGEMIHLAQTQLVPAEARLTAALDALLAQQQQRAEQPVAAAARDYARARAWLLLLACVTLAAGAWAAWRISLGIVRPLRQAMRLAQEVATGDLTRAIRTERQDETGALFASLKRMQDSLGEIAAQIRSVASNVSATTDELAGESESLSQRTEEQAATIEETASIMASLRESAEQNANQAQLASASASETQATAQQGGAAMRQVTQTMSAINEAAKRIGDITAVMDTIAFQTNILALNAAVEAARAGEQGRGFAVVAAEVRRLAQQSGTASQEIRALINTTVERIGAGSREVELASAAVADVVNKVSLNARAMAQIAQASNAQAGSVGEVNQAVQQLERVTQQNAGLVHRSQAAVEVLQKETQRLLQSVAWFKLVG